jgi:hypothetical protein
MKSSVLIAVAGLSLMSVGASAVWMLEPTAKHVVSMKTPAGDLPIFRWGEGTEASLQDASAASTD